MFTNRDYYHTYITCILCQGMTPLSLNSY